MKTVCITVETRNVHVRSMGVYGDLYAVTPYRHDDPARQARERKYVVTHLSTGIPAGGVLRLREARSLARYYAEHSPVEANTDNEFRVVELLLPIFKAWRDTREEK